MSSINHNKLSSQSPTRQSSISMRLSSNLVVCISTICIIFILLTYTQKKRVSEEMFEKKAKEFQELLTSSMTIPMWDIDRDTISEIGRSFMNNQIVCRLKIIDPLNRVIYSQQKKDRDDAVRLTWDILYHQESIGQIEMDVSPAYYRKKNEELLISTMMTLLIVILVISLTTGYFLKVVLKKPFEELSSIVDSYSSGQYEQTRTETSYIEFDQFVKVLNQMAQKIIHQNEELEQRVIARTKELDEANQELQKLAILAEEANKAKGEFLTNVSHELRTPMNGILGMASVLEDMEMDEGSLECVQIIQNSARDLLSLINDLLDYSSLDAGKLKLDIQDFDLAQTLQTIFNIFHSKAHAKGIEFTHTQAPDVPAQLIGDPGRLQQILANLLDNAVKFTESGSIHLQIDLQEDTSQAYILCFKISDTGIGIQQSEMRHLFKLFSQVDASVTRKYGGTGLGLIISKKLVDLIGGEINVSSEKDKGSTFWFTLTFYKQVKEKNYA